MNRIIEVDGEKAYELKNFDDYFITKSGKLYSIKVVGGQGKTDITKPHLMVYGQDKDGYYRVVLSIKSKVYYKRIHTLVVNQFIGEVIPPMVINHKNGDKHLNDISNLEIISVKDNAVHAHENFLVGSDTVVTVEFEGETYKFPSMTHCNKRFPELSMKYLQDIKYNRFKTGSILFKRDDTTGEIIAIKNSEKINTFKSCVEADRFFKFAKGHVSSSILNCSENSYRYRVNKYKVMI